MLLLLLLLPIVVTLAAYLIGKGRICLQEFLLQEAIVIVVIVSGYYIALGNKSSDTELWNGVIAKKWEGTEGCCHSYECNCHESCSGSGNDRSCSTHCDTCYEHSHDKYWAADTSNGERVYRNGCNSPYSSTPARWTAIRIGEPTVVEHDYTNYIKGNPDSILRRQGLAQGYPYKIPQYPRVYDHYRSVKAFSYVPGIDIKAINQRLLEINGELGAAKQVNLLVIFTPAPDQNYVEVLRELWLGGKKNDVVIVVGMPNAPEIAWADVMSWSKSEDMKINIRDKLLAAKTWDNSLVEMVRLEVGNRFVRRRWADFDYLKSTIEPSKGAQIALFIIGFLLSLGLSVIFYKYDPFNTEYRNKFNRRFR